MRKGESYSKPASSLQPKCDEPQTT